MASRSGCIRTRAAYSLCFALLLISYAKGDSEEDKQKCAERLEGASTCLPYIRGDAKAPTADCCNGLKDAIKNNNRCLCLMLKDWKDPKLGFSNINLTLSIGLPYICKAAENLSQCPALLHLDPNSPEAQVFNQVNRSFTGGHTGSPIFSPPVGISPAEGVRTGTRAKNEACKKRKGMLVPGILAAGLLIWIS